ncbi:MAG: molecular chaperone DnaJ [Tissierellia bacterium]|nr:molecular chaperone DnaJ [Tissierellia bacterium]
MRDFYEILEVSRSATDVEIKKAYRKKAKQYHPDLHPGDEDAEQRFKEVNTAYEVLSDATKRKRYDMYGEAGIDPNAQAQGGYSGGFGDIFGDIFDIFGGGFSGGGFGGGYSASPGAKAPRKGADIRYDLNLSFKEAVFGTEKEIPIRRTETCGHCHGTGAEEGTSVHSCEKCHGTGQIRQTTSSAFGRFVQVVPCDVCGGTGEIIEEPCSVCHGHGVETKNRKLNVKIPAGVDERSVISLKGEGHAGEHGGGAGSVYVYLHIAEDEIFKRDGADLFVDVPIHYVDAVLGGNIRIPTLEKIVDYAIPAGTQGGDTFSLRGQGVPRLRREGRGNLYFTVSIFVPDKVSDDEKKLLEELRHVSSPKMKEREKGFFEKLKDFFD